MRGVPFLIPAVLLAACGSDGRADSGHGMAGTPGPGGTRSFAASGFDAVSLRGPDNVVVRHGAATSVSAAGDSETLDHLSIAVVHGELRIGRDTSGWSSNGHPATITVTLPALKAAAVAGSGNMTVDRIEAAEMAAAVSGSGDLAIAASRGHSADLAVSGSGTLTIGGQADSVSISVSGSGSVDAAQLQSATASVSAVGSGDITAMARTSADISIVGSGDVRIRGGAHCSVSKLGSGDADCG